MCILLQNKVLVNTKRKQSQLQQKGFGERQEKEFVLDLKEALYLAEKGKIKLRDAKDKEIDEKELLKYAEKKEKGFYSKYIVYRDFRDRGYCIKTGFKFGFDFRVYPRGKKVGEEHTKWVVAVETQDARLTMPQLSRMVRLAGNLRAELLIAVVDSENDINYYPVKRIVP